MNVTVNEEKLRKLQAYIDNIMYDKTKNTLGDWLSDYGATVNDNYTITFGSHYALTKMLLRRDKEVIRNALAEILEHPAP